MQRIPSGTHSTPLNLPRPALHTVQHTSRSTRSTNHPHRKLNRNKRARAHWHRPQQRRSDAPPKATHALSPPRLGKAIAHTLVLHRVPKAIALHLALDHVEWVATNPQHLSRESTVQGHLERANLVALDVVARRIGIH
jgi:hypothetical protein